MDSKIKAASALVIVAVIAACAVYVYNQQDVPRYSKKVAGVQVYSNIPFEDFSKKKVVALIDMPGTKAETTCNFEISAVSTLDPKGYLVRMERKPAAVYLDWKEATLSGESDEEILAACHAFICLRDEIACSADIMDIKNITLKNMDMVIVLDNRAGPAAMKGFVELSGALGFLQAQLVDKDRNGIVEQSEVNESKIHIYSYIMQGEVCKLQHFQDALQITNVTNDTTECNFKSGIILERSKSNAITIDGRRIIISGDDEHIFIASVIVRDILSPEYVRFLHRLY